MPTDTENERAARSRAIKAALIEAAAVPLRIAAAAAEITTRLDDVVIEVRLSAGEPEFVVTAVPAAPGTVAGRAVGGGAGDREEFMHRRPQEDAPDGARLMALRFFALPQPGQPAPGPPPEGIP